MDDSDREKRIYENGKREERKAKLKFILICASPFIIALGLAIFCAYMNASAYRCFICKKMIPKDQHYCDDHRCIEEGCDNAREEGLNGYCGIHYDEHYPTYCQYPGCHSKIYYTDEYCYTHTCHALGCNNVVYNDTKYCKDHQDMVSAATEKTTTAAKKTCAVSGCDNDVVSGKKYCKQHACCIHGCNQKAKYDLYGNRYCTTHYNQVAGSYTISDEWPDVDDYEDLDDFLDDWEGEMPDGSDAEDYWEDHY